MKTCIAKIILPLALAAGAMAADRVQPSIDASRYLEHVRYLASEEMRGRGTGTPELEKAAGYLARQFRSFGLQPVEGSSFLLEFPVTVNARLGKGNRFEYTLAGRRHSLKPQQDFQPLNFSSSGKFSGPVVFAGYGITAREYNYDDYAGLDVRDKLVLVLRHEPQEFDEKSVFAGKVYTEHAQLFSKAVNAKQHGARGILFLNDAANHPADSDEMEKFGRTAGPTNAGIAFVQVRAQIGAQWLAQAGKDVKQMQEAIDRDLRPQSLALAETLQVSFEVDLARDARTVHNVAGYLPGETAEHIVVGAHYDHLGLGEQFSLAPSQAGTPHPGADDNASGTAGVLELARWFAGRGKQKRGILFLAFAGEELGLLGSSHYVNHPRLALSQAVAMLNMDMIGRIRDRKVYLGGAGTGTTFRGILNEVGPRHQDLRLELSDQTGYGSSDHTSFTAKQVPVLFLFSGLHGDYHKPSDTWDKIDAPQTAQLLEFAADLIARLAGDAERPQFVRLADPRPAHMAQASGSTGSGYGPYFGSIPDFAEVPKGVRFSDVREGSPAAKAGLRGGDIMIEFDGKPIENLYDFTYALRGKKPGEEVAVKVLRDGKPLEVKVLLEQRR